MGFIDWAKAVFNNGTRTLDLNDCFYTLNVEYYYKKLAVETCVGIIAGAVSRCEIETFQNGKPIRGEMHYLFNVQPNVNQNATEFFGKATRKYIYDGECLIIVINNQYYIADDWEVKEYVTEENIYRKVRIGDLNMDKVFYEHEVIHLKLTDEKMIKVIDDLYSSFGKLLASSMDFYKRKNNKRIMIKGDFLREQTEEMEKKIENMFKRQFKDWFDPDKAGVTLQMHKGYEAEDMSDSESGTKGSGESTDVRNLINDVFDFVSMGLHVPKGILKGDVVDTEKQTDNLIMFGISPITELIASEFNRKVYTKEEYLARTYLKVDTSKIKITDLGQLATALDKLFAIGGLTINDVQKELGKDPIDGEHGDKRYITKNYAEVGVETALGGGEN